jgi:hypothetical protein
VLVFAGAGAGALVFAGAGADLLAVVAVFAVAPNQVLLPLCPTHAVSLFVDFE